MRKQKATCVVVLAAVLACSSPVVTLAAPKIEVNEGDRVIIEGSSNGKKTSKKHTNSNRGSSSESSRQSTKAERACQKAQSSVRRVLKKFIENWPAVDVAIAGNLPTNPSGSGDSSSNSRYEIAYGIDTPELNDLFTLDVINAPINSFDEIQQQLDVFNNNVNNTDLSNVYYNRNDTPTSSLQTKESVKHLSAKKKKKIKKAIANEEHLNTVTSKSASHSYPSTSQPSSGTGDSGTVDDPFHIGGDGEATIPDITFPTQTNPSIVIDLNDVTISDGSSDNSGLDRAPISFTYPDTDYNDSDTIGGIRTDLVNGGLNDVSLWNHRFEVLKRLRRSNAMNDYCTLAVLTDYHISEVKEDYVTETDASSDVRHWVVTDLDSGKIVQEADTANPMHRFNFSGFGEGNYSVQEYRQVRQRTGMYISYDYCQYLIDAETKRILFFKESLVSNGQGKSVFVGAENENSLEPTGQVFNIRVNALGQIVRDSNTTERVK